MSVLKWLRLRSRPLNDNPPPRTDGLDVLNLNGRLAARTPGNHYAELLSESGTPVNSVARAFTLTPLTTVVDGEVFGIGDYYLEFNASDGVTVSNPSAAPVRAQGTITLTGVPAATGTLVVGATTYTFRAIADFDAAGEIGIPAAATAAAQASYIAAAINGTDGVNTANLSASAKVVGSTVVITALNIGTGGNVVVFTESATNLTINGSGTLGATTAGVDPPYFPVDITPYADKSEGTLTIAAAPTANDTMTIGTTVYTFKATPTAAGHIRIGANALDSAANIISAINGLDGFNTANAFVSAGGEGGGTIVFTALVGGAAGDSIVTTETFTAAGNVFDAATLGTTTAGSDPSVAEICDAVVSAITAFGSGGSDTLPFSATDGTTTATITSDLHGAEVNGWPIKDGFAGTLVQATAGVTGTAGIRGCSMDDATNVYVLRSANESLKSYVWRKVAHSAL